jgi:ATP-binding cassette subfamily F protein 3
MAFVQFTEVSLAFGARDILTEAALYLADGTKAALAGPNGAGKTTLLRIVSGEIKPDSGSRAIQKDTRVSYLPQSGASFGGCTVYQEAEKAYAALESLVSRRDALAGNLETLEAGDERLQTLLAAYQHLDESINDSGYWRRRERIVEVLVGLGFVEADMNRPVGELSGGWQMRVALAKVILENPDIMLLDEPTNYLDIEARDWLEGYLRSFKGGFVVVSHDRSFLDATVREVYELWNGKLSRYPGSYSAYERQRVQELDTLFKAWEAQQEEIARLEDFIRRFRYKPTKAAQVQSRVKQLEKIERIIIPEGMKKAHFSFPAPPHCGRIALVMDEIGKSYGDKRVVDTLTITIDSGSKIAFVGRNGAGKSTLMRIIAGVDKDHDGRLQYGTGISVAWFSQDVSDSLDDSLTVEQEAELSCPSPLLPGIRTMLGAFLFRGDDVYKPVKVLSGGERSRLALLKMLLHPANLLVLDEPTNHLDLDSKDVLLAALKRFQGTVLFVSHDKFFIEGLADKVLELSCGSTPRLFYGDYAYYLDKKAREAAGRPDYVPVASNVQPGPPARLPAGSGTDNTARATSVAHPAGLAGSAGLAGPCDSAAVEGRPGDGKANRELDKRRKADYRRLKKRELEILARIEELDAEKAQTVSAMSSPENYADGARMRALLAQAVEIDAATARLSADWETLALELAVYTDLA